MATNGFPPDGGRINMVHLNGVFHGVYPYVIMVRKSQFALKIKLLLRFLSHILHTATGNNIECLLHATSVFGKKIHGKKHHLQAASLNR